MPGGLSGKAAIVGIGATDFSKDSGRSELRLASEAVLDALDDAGLTPADVDGMVTFTMDSNRQAAHQHPRRSAGRGLYHGMNGIAEGVRQLRGTSVNQVDDVAHVLVTAGTGVPTSGLILG